MENILQVCLFYHKSLMWLAVLLAHEVMEQIFAVKTVICLK